MSPPSFTNSTIFLEYNGQRVGALLFHFFTQPSALDAAGSESITNSTVALPPVALPATQTTYKPNGENLSPAGVYISLASALVQMAKRPGNSRIFALSFAWPEFDTRIKITPEIREEPLSIAVVEGIAAVWSTATYLTQRARYAELWTVVIVQGKLVGVLDVDYVEGAAVQMPNPGVAAQVDTT